MADFLPIFYKITHFLHYIKELRQPYPNWTGWRKRFYKLRTPEHMHLCVNYYSISFIFLK